MDSENNPHPSRVDLKQLAGRKVTIMGLGLHGGGVESARYCASQGAQVLVTDLRDESTLEPSLEQLKNVNITYVLGKHREVDFKTADLVIKNPGVKRTNPYLQLAPQIATDLALFLANYPGPILGITGTKGKSSTVSALAFGLQRHIPRTKLGGNITVSPLSFLAEIQQFPTTPVVLELSSFQLGDLQYSGAKLPLTFSGITNIESDHQDYYGSMETYVQDKEVLYSHQQPGSWACFNGDQPSWTRRFLSQLPNQVQPWCFFSHYPKAQDLASLGISEPETRGLAWIEDSLGYIKYPGESLTSLIQLIPANLKVPGEHQRMNLLLAGLGMARMGIQPEVIGQTLSHFPGIPHRLEYLGTLEDVEYYNDSAATIPEAVVMGVRSFKSKAVHLICGGTNKGLDFLPFSTISDSIASAHLLDGSATPGIRQALVEGLSNRKISNNVQPIFGPFSTLDAVVSSAKAYAKPGDVIVLSPGCASFGLFLNEFDRGNQFRSLISRLQKVGQK